MLFIILSLICWFVIIFLSKDYEFIAPIGFKQAGGGGGKKGGSGKTTVDYHFGYSLAELQVYEKSNIIFEVRLGNTVIIGDGITSSASVPNVWLKKYFWSSGFGYIKIYPESIRLYTESLDNELTEGADFTYDNTTGSITFTTPPTDKEIIQGQWTYDEDKPDETTFYPDFSTKDLIKRIGIKHFKYTDSSLYTYEKCAKKGKQLQESLYKAINPGSFNLHFNPKVKIGQSVLVTNSKTGEQRIYMIENIDENHSGKSHTLNMGGISFPETGIGISQYEKVEVKSKLYLYVPSYAVNFIRREDNFNEDTMPLIADVKNVIGAPDESYKANCKLLITIPNSTYGDKTVEMPDSNFGRGNDVTIKNKSGRLYSGYDWSFRVGAGKEYEDEAELANHFTEFDDEHTFFARRTVKYKLYDTIHTDWKMIAENLVFIGKKAITSFYCFYVNQQHLAFIDIDRDLWITDLKFNTYKIGSIPLADYNQLQYITCDGKYIYSVLGDTTINRFNESTGNWDFLDNITLQTSPTIPYYPITDENGYTILSVGHYSPFGGAHYIQKLTIKGDVLLQEEFGSCHRGNLFIFDNIIYLGYTGYDLQGNLVDSANTGVIVDWEDWVRVTNKEKNTLVALVQSGSAATPPHNRFLILKKISNNNWETMIDFTIGQNTSANDVNFTLLFLIGKTKAVGIISGSDFENTVLKKSITDVRKALCVIDLDTKKMKIINILRESSEAGEYHTDYHTTIQWFKDKILWNWQDFSSEIEEMENCPIAEFQGD